MVKASPDQRDALVTYIVLGAIFFFGAAIGWLAGGAL